MQLSQKTDRNSRKTKKKSFERRVLDIVIIAIVGNLFWALYNQEIKIREINSEIAKLQSEIEIETDKQERLKRKIEKATTDENIERLAREKLKMVRPDEKVYVDINKLK